MSSMVGKLRAITYEEMIFQFLSRDLVKVLFVNNTISDKETFVKFLITTL